MDRLRQIARLAASLLVSFALLAGCAPVSPLAPSIAPEPEPAPVVVDESVPPPPSRFVASDAGTAGLSWILNPLNLLWYTISTRDVRVGQLEVVKANRYQLTFQRGSLFSDITCTIKEYDRDVLDIELGPHGTKFAEPVTLSIDFSDTPADPKSAVADGCEPVVWWWNDVHRRWEEVPGSTDWTTRLHTVRLAHFSRYVVGGKAGWKGQPSREND